MVGIYRKPSGLPVFSSTAAPAAVAPAPAAAQARAPTRRPRISSEPIKPEVVTRFEALPDDQQWSLLDSWRVPTSPNPDPRDQQKMKWAAPLALHLAANSDSGNIRKAAVRFLVESDSPHARTVASVAALTFGSRGGWVRS